MANDCSRRHFSSDLCWRAQSGRRIWEVPSLKAVGYKSPNEKLNIAPIGGGESESDIKGCASENIVALCDVDDSERQRNFHAARQGSEVQRFSPDARRGIHNIDAVIVTIPDFMHATAAIWAMERGKHVYVQKPLTHTVGEAASFRKQPKYKVATQMGNQGYSNEGTRQAAEMIWAGEIGNVTEVHAWTNRPIWPQGLSQFPAQIPFRLRSIGTSGWASRTMAVHFRRAWLQLSPVGGHFFYP